MARRPKPCADLQCGRCAPRLQNKRAELDIAAAKVRRMADDKLREPVDAMLARIVNAHRRSNVPPPTWAPGHSVEYD